MRPALLLESRVMVRRPTNTSFRHISVALWFPPGDETAAHLARHCALREDLYIEFQGLHGEPLTLLDECSDGYRRTFFLGINYVRYLRSSAQFI